MITFESDESNEKLEGLVAEKRSRIEKEDNDAKVARARAVLEKNTRKRKVALGRNCKLLPDDRAFLQNLFSRTGSFGDLKLYDSKFPGEL